MDAFGDAPIGDRKLWFIGNWVKCRAEIIVVADHSKFGRNVLTNVMPFKEVGVFITDSGISKPFLDLFKKYSIEYKIAGMHRMD